MRPFILLLLGAMTSLQATVAQKEVNAFNITCESEPQLIRAIDSDRQSGIYSVKRVEQNDFVFLLEQFTNSPQSLARHHILACIPTQMLSRSSNTVSTHRGYLHTASSSVVNHPLIRDDIAKPLAAAEKRYARS